MKSLPIIGMFLASVAFAAPLPPGEKDAKAALDKSPRHGEMVEIAVPDGKPIKGYIVYPETKDKAPVVIVIHEIFGLSDWVRGVADELAAEGFIAVAPDLLSGHGDNGGGSETFPERDAVMKAVGGLRIREVSERLNATREFATKLPAASGKFASIGFCWGGGKSFLFASEQPEMSAAVVYYGTPPSEYEMSKIKCPVAGFYGGDDGRVIKTVKGTTDKMKELNKSYSPHVYDGAGHGFLRQQDGKNGANMKAAEQAWPATIEFLKEHTK